ncbi:Glucose dehydrogenase/choline dehydrogenase/mandelonitrile lyase (GMC oxidoreductase family) [Ceraceosorus bombacis]|uniref:Glucose dehydrogenase/choline dehydrogenase/mandelonitrile lyase (GMC oxidoreductase family) n=1 Tax=Ceraceosorus bombacis TaxID=401625 RepID=A0A0P1BH73_9BASI|nr:Glucose dehydrogenase/choline dehydrogenase/mandelonitrile lyase (GMC oxidoreductase family) [Ceraceosorus bombacis]
MLENSKNTVLCVEAGSDTRTADNVVHAYNYGSVIQDGDKNFKYPTIAQPTANGRQLSVSAGKGLGGSTSINGLAVTRPPQSQVDAFGQDLSTGWSWETLLPYMKKAEKFNPPSDDLKALGADWDPSAHGTDGPVAVGFPSTLYRGEIINRYSEAITNTVGTPHIQDNSNGKVPLDGVGKHLTEQTMSSLGANGGGDPDGNGPSALIAVSKNAMLKQFRSQVAGIFDKQEGLVELFADNGYPSDRGGLVWNLLPFSRGSVSASANSAFGNPRVDPRYFSASWDLDVQIQAARAVRRIFQKLGVQENIPGFDAGNGGIPDGPQHGNYRRWRDFVLNRFSSVAHPMSTCMMAPREDGGVVDNNFKVYSTSNVFVADASVVPMSISAHLQSFLYGVAELAADKIMGRA